ncbi:hypothetical protein P0E66_13890 [Enterococcus faecalis]|uniref:hypothetical protein n=1 Tax=Enterococcus faecalis TaxID=1351 RepID=UPI001A079857|nr:hypothetical protein [Enterococcus faecalis]EGO8428663.1 hypothetical protein [Enterococcus faecalis]MDN3202217.1 hypothetical protein [Enterococcus faecalis]
MDFVSTILVASLTSIISPYIAGRFAIKGAIKKDEITWADKYANSLLTIKKLNEEIVELKEKIVKLEFQIEQYERERGEK